MKVWNAQVRLIQFCALQGWPLSTATAAPDSEKVMAD